MYRRAPSKGKGEGCHTSVGAVYLTCVKLVRMVAVAAGTLLVLASTTAGFSASFGEQSSAAGAGSPGSAEPMRDVAESADAGHADDGNGASGAAEVRALAAAYPSVIKEYAYRDGDWAVRIGEVWYYWAGGRLLPDELRSEAEQYVSIRFYDYELGPMPKRSEVPPEREAALRERTDAVTSSGDDRLRFNDFLDTLYGVSSLQEAEATMHSVQFLGRWIRVHPLLVAPLGRVEERIEVSAQADNRVRGYVENLASIHAYNWRNIAGTLRRSYHSYGVALDLVPASYDGRWAYWLWAAESGVEKWWNLDMNERLQVPQPIIDAFETEGFIWGGKWTFFDNLHFEYRPESIILAVERR